MVIEDGRPIFAQIAELIESLIVDGSLAEGEQVPSTIKLAAFHRINPATAAKGVNQLVTDGVLHKRRGIGMFVSDGARAALRQRRREQFARQYVHPLVTEARKLGIGTAELQDMISSAELEATEVAR